MPEIAKDLYNDDQDHKVYAHVKILPLDKKGY